MTEPAEYTVRIAKILDELGIAYHVGGSAASVLHGTPRTTVDLDVVVAADSAQIGRLVATLRSDFYVADAAVREAMESRGSFNAISLRDPFKIDFFLLGPSRFDQEEFRRAVRVEFPGSGPPGVRVKTPEDLVLRKLEWFHRGGRVSDRQWSDVLGILSAQRGRLDEAYLNRWASELGVEELLARARLATEAEE